MTVVVVDWLTGHVMESRRQSETLSYHSSLVFKTDDYVKCGHYLSASVILLH